MKHLICFSGGHSSGLVALEVANRFGTENMILLNHDISKEMEHADIKRFKKELADYLCLPITYANYEANEVNTNQFDISINKKAFAVRTSDIKPICTIELKTKPFYKWLENNIDDYIIYYGFDSTEKHRIERRINILSKMGYKSDYPLALWYKSDLDIYNQNQLELFTPDTSIKAKFEGERVFNSTNQVGIKPPMTYEKFKHANCIGCLRGGKQHWYVVFCLYPEIFQKAKEAEKILNHSIIKDHYLSDLESIFTEMKEIGIEATEKIESSTFWYNAKKKINSLKVFDTQDLFSCSVECIA